MADERSVDVDEPRGDQPQPEGPRLPALPIAGKLSPVQQAYGAYTSHFLTCSTCRDIDLGRCEEGERRWRSYGAAQEEAYRRLRGETA